MMMKKEDVVGRIQYSHYSVLQQQQHKMGVLAVDEIVLMI